MVIGAGEKSRMTRGVVDSAPPLTLLARVAAADGPIRYEVDRDGRRFTVALSPRP